MKHFNWVFRELISRKSPYALASRLGKPRGKGEDPLGEVIGGGEGQ